ncbi:cold shock domain-containing protein, partial [Pseudomonas aeruginosa]|uniref:cold shock domain-containing protein n=1 Tax=Pseudomonas aeruginosa TaxID=287 RepID=UPI003D2AC552
GQGFIRAGGREEALSALSPAIQRDGKKTLRAGQRVIFEITRGPRGLQPTNISPATATTAAPSAPAPQEEPQATPIEA